MEIYLKIYIFIIANKPKYVFVLFHLWRVFLWPQQNINISIQFTTNENVFLYKQKSQACYITQIKIVIANV